MWVFAAERPAPPAAAHRHLPDPPPAIVRRVARESPKFTCWLWDYKRLLWNSAWPGCQEFAASIELESCRVAENIWFLRFWEPSSLGFYIRVVSTGLSRLGFILSWPSTSTDTPNSSCFTTQGQNANPHCPRAHPSCQAR